MNDDIILCKNEDHFNYLNKYFQNINNYIPFRILLCEGSNAYGTRYIHHKYIPMTPFFFSIGDYNNIYSYESLIRIAINLEILDLTHIYDLSDKNNVLCICEDNCDCDESVIEYIYDNETFSFEIYSDDLTNDDIINHFLLKPKRNNDFDIKSIYNLAKNKNKNEYYSTDKKNKKYIQNNKQIKNITKYLNKIQFYPTLLEKIETHKFLLSKYNTCIEHYLYEQYIYSNFNITPINGFIKLDIE